MDLTEVIFFDAGGTLFEVRGGIGKIYSEIAGCYGITVDPERVDALFRTAFLARTSKGFPEVTGDLASSEKQWWFDLVQEVLSDRMPESIFPAYFAELYDHFRSADAWLLYPEVPHTLEQLQAKGHRMGIISNFDSRLKDIIANLGIAPFVEQITTSWSAKSVKPDRRIFLKAAADMQVPPSRATHLGDSIREDVEGAKNAGLIPILIDRNSSYPQWNETRRIHTLSDLLNSFG
jgi:putative hydrolase of the HAD superfamily